MLSQRGRYALKAMMNLARLDHQRPQRISVIAMEEAIPRKFLEAIMGELRQRGLVESVRGKHGGYRLARAADAISFAQVIRATEGPLALFPCASVNFYRPCEDCDVATCVLRKVL